MSHWDKLGMDKPMKSCEDLPNHQSHGKDEVAERSVQELTQDGTMPQAPDPSPFTLGPMRGAGK